MKKENLILVLVGLILLVVVSIGIYFVMSEQQKNQKADYAKKITALESQISEKDKKLAEDQLSIKGCEDAFKSLGSASLPTGFTIPTFPGMPTQ